LCSGDTIRPEDLPPEVTGPEARPGPPPEPAAPDTLFRPETSLNEALERVEKEMIRRALRRAGHIQAHAADLLGIKKNVMQYKLKKYPPQDLDPETGPDLELEGVIPPTLDLNDTLETIEKKLLQQALGRAGGVQAKAAEALGITKRMMLYKMKKYNL
ncbi:MAG: helix-turn-helix domain-containing protein, partial [Thermodesulfobacteriota bacterium]